MKKLSASDIRKAKKIAHENFYFISEGNSGVDSSELPHFDFNGICIVDPWMDETGRFEYSDEEAIETYGLANVINFILQIIK